MHDDDGGASHDDGDDVFSTQTAPETTSSTPIYSASGGFVTFSPVHARDGVDGGFGNSDGLILPPPTDMAPEEGFALREWRR